MIIDNNVHWMPETLFQDEDLLNAFLRIPPRSSGVFAKIDTIPGTDRKQLIIEQPKGYANLNYTELDVNAEKRLATMDEVGIDKAVLRIPCWEEWMSLEMAKKLNDMIAKTVKAHPDRFAALAFVPPWDDKDCRYEMERCVKELGCVGVELAAHYGNMHLDEEEFRPMWQKINELGVPAVIHHTPLPAEYQSLYQMDKVRRSLGRNHAQMICITRNIFSGLFDEFPDLKVIHSYLAGGFFAFTGVLNMKRPAKVNLELRRVNDNRIGDKFDSYLKNNLFFDMCHAPPWGKDHLEFAIKILGADHVLYGSSYPIRLDWTYDGVEFVNNLDISEDDKALVLGGNAMRLFKMKA